MNLAVVGTSWITEKFVSAAIETRMIRFLGTVSRSEEKAQQLNRSFNGSKTYLTVDQACADEEVDILYIASPNSLHYPYAKKALLAGKHVISEKPIVSHTREIDDLIEISKTSQGMLFEAIMPLHLPGLEIIRQHLSMLGDIRLISTEFSQYSSKYPAYLLGKDPNVFSPQFSGGALYDLGVYNVYFILSLFESPSEVRYMANQGPNGIDLSGVLTMKYPDKIAVSAIGKDNPGDNRTLIQGEKGFIKVTGPVSTLSAIEIVAEGQRFEFMIPNHPNTMFHEAADIFTCIRNQDRPLMNEWLSLAKQVATVMETARKDAGIVFAADQHHD